MAFAAVVGARERERIVATSCYYLDPESGFADVAYLVDPEWQGAGLGGILHDRMVEYARARGGGGGTPAGGPPHTPPGKGVPPRGPPRKSAVSGGVVEVRLLFRDEAAPQP